MIKQTQTELDTDCGGLILTSDSHKQRLLARDIQPRGVTAERSTCPIVLDNHMQAIDFQQLNSEMETSFYHDNSVGGAREAVKKMKSSMSLDFNTSQKKRATQTTHNLLPGVLASPDLHMLKLASPELERMIIQQSNGMVTTTPTPTQFICPKYVTDEQEAYARGFVDALAKLHENQPEQGQPQHEQDVQQQHQQNNVSTAPVVTSSMTMLEAPNTSSSMLTTLTTMTPCSTMSYQTQCPVSMSMPYTTTSIPDILPTSTSAVDMMPGLSSHQPIYTTVRSEAPASQSQQNGYTMQPLPHRVLQLKEEPQTVPCLGFSPPISPIDMESQERIKLERKRERNRVAARKCRTRKLERISRLEDRVQELKGQNSELTMTANTLRDQVCKLKSQIMTHVKSGCQVVMSQNLL